MRGKRRIATVGELRRLLAEQGDPWSVDPRLKDDDPLPVLPTGGQAEEDIPEEHRLHPIGPDVDLGAILAENPPTNLWLALDWAEAGLLDRSVADEVRPMDVTEFGPS